MSKPEAKGGPGPSAVVSSDADRGRDNGSPPGAMLDPSAIMQLGTAFMASKTLLSAVELDVFTTLGDGALTATDLARRLALDARAVPDFPDTLVALGMLEREGQGSDARYRNTEATAAFLNRDSPTYIGGILEMCNARLYRFWGDLTEGLRTGEPQNEIKATGKSAFEKLYSDPARLEQFVSAMSGLSLANFEALAEEFDFSRYATLCDAGGAAGHLSITVARRHPHMRCTTFDLPEVEPIARRTIESAAIADRVRTAAGDFLVDPLPKADVIVMSHVLHDWNTECKLQLIRAAYDALPDGGAFIAIENLIDDARRESVIGLLFSLNMLIELGDASGFSGADFAGWCAHVGFKETRILPLAGPTSAAIAYR